MSNQEEVRSLIAHFSGQTNIITIPKIYIEILDEYNSAAILNQIVFWSDKSARNDGYFYKTYAEWEKEVNLTEYQVRRSIKKLKELGFVETKVKKANGSPTLHYKLDKFNLSNRLLKFLKYETLNSLGNVGEVSSVSLTDDYTDDYNIHVASLDKKVKQGKDDKIPYKQIIEYLNEKTGKKFNYKTESHRKHIRGRYKEGSTLDDFKTVIDLKSTQWIGNDKMEQYLRPPTLFNSDNFDKYLNEKPVRQNKVKSEAPPTLVADEDDY